MENPIKMDDLGVPLFLETSIYQTYVQFEYHRNVYQNHQGFGVPDALGRAAAESGAGAPWRSSGVASVGAGPGLGAGGEAEAWKLGVQTSGFFVESMDIFYFHPYLGKIPILTNIFQGG